MRILLTYHWRIGRNKVINERGLDSRAGNTKLKSRYSKGISSLEGLDGATVKLEHPDDPDYYSPTDEDSDGGPKVNVERMEELVDSEEEDEIEINQEKMPVMFPLRVERMKHEEKIAPVPIFKDPEMGKKGGKGSRKVKVEEGGTIHHMNTLAEISN